ncbi:VOC family protein [Faecalimonas sp.]
MKLKNILIVVKDIEKSKQFYHDLFGLDMVLDHFGNVILTEGLVLQDEKIWKEFLEKDMVHKNNCCELYFEEKDIEAFVEKLDNLYPSIEYVNRLRSYDSGKKILRFYDLDGNLIEVGTPI